MSGDDDLEREVRERVEADAKRSAQDVVPSMVGDQSVRIALFLERSEKLRSLTPRSIVIDPEHPETSPDLLEIERMYNEALVPDDVLRALDENDKATFLEGINLGGMLNPFDPTESERRYYPEGYESVKKQIMTDLLGTSKRPGQYVIRGMFDPEGKLRAYLSLRLPPKKPADPASYPEYREKLQAYVEYLEKSLELRDVDLQSSQSGIGIGSRTLAYDTSCNREALRGELSTMWEFDTVNVQKGWGGAGMLVVKDALDLIEREFDAGDVTSAYAYRYRCLRVTDEAGREHKRGANMSSNVFLENKLGFFPIADKSDKRELVIREMPDGNCSMYHPEWTYLWCDNATMKSQVAHFLKKYGLLS